VTFFIQAKLRGDLGHNNAVIAPVILASDETHLSVFMGDKKAYPVYLTLGNIPKAIRRQPSQHATVLVGYLPVEKLHIFRPESRHMAASRLFHHCMTEILQTLAVAGRDGVEVTCADGWVRRIHPIFAAYVADQPEQCLIACCKKNRCHICSVEVSQMGELGTAALREQTKVLDAIQAGPADSEFVRLGLKDVSAPFWATLPYVNNIFSSFTPDLLHQLHKGVFGDHLLKWCLSVLGPEEVDRRFMAMPKHPSVHHFAKGVSTISQLNGKECRNIEKVFLGVGVGYPDVRLQHAVRALLDFIYCARMPQHSEATLNFMADAHRRLHDGKAIFIEKQIRAHFNFPKFHSLTHYSMLIRLYGGADGFSTETPERLHIDCAKKAYRASNRKRYTEQMTRWLRRQEAVHRFRIYLDWLQGREAEPGMDSDNEVEIIDSDEDGEGHSAVEEVEEEEIEDNSAVTEVKYFLAKVPEYSNRKVRDIIRFHGADQFIPCLRQFIKEHLPQCQLEPSPRDCFSVYNRVRIIHNTFARGNYEASVLTDVIRAAPACRLKEATFDTALVSRLDNEDIDDVNSFQGL
jgi:hypothetical protein